MITPERWQELRNVLYEALQVAPADRSAFLDRACASDSALRQELESLLAASDEVRPSFLKSSSSVLAIKPGTRLDDYEVETLIGSGGMGEVYRARDTRLRRVVAIKVLPKFVSNDPDRLRRFEHEAQAAAALNHPNIVGIFHLSAYQGTPYMVLELLDGLKLGRLHIVVFTLCFIALFLDGMDFGTVLVAAPAILRDWHLPQNAGTSFFDGRAASPELFSLIPVCA